jgi:hypothetical protein
MIERGWAEGLAFEADLDDLLAGAWSEHWT